MLPIGYVLAGSYRITRLLGRGGMACVYEVSHVRLPTRFAVKVITSEITQDSKFLGRFRQEAEILARLKHPHVVHVFDWQETQEGQPYLVMELLEGEDLAQRLRRSGALPLAEALPIFLQIGDAVQAAHDQGVIHRDLKPANAFVLSNGAFPNYIKVLDFGIAKSVDASSALRTKDAVLLGTPAYMAPEQARGLPASTRTDQFALALVLYEMLAGQAAFYVPEDDLLQTLARILLDDPPPLPYPQLEPVLRRALSKDPRDRFPSVRDFVAATGALELSIIRPLCSHTRPMPRIDPADAAPSLAAVAPGDMDSTLKERTAGPADGTEPPAAPPSPERAPGEPEGPPLAHPATLSRPSITGQKISEPGTRRRGLKLAIGGACVALLILTVLRLTSLALHSPAVAEQAPVRSGTLIPKSERSAEPRAPHAEPSTPAPVAAMDAPERVAPQPPPVLQRPSEALTSSSPGAAAPEPSSHPLGHRVVRPPAPRKPRPAGPKVAAAAVRAAEGPLEFVLAGDLTEAQREFISGCLGPLGPAARSAITLRPIALLRNNGRFTIDADKLPESDEEGLERCLSPMSDRMLLPQRVQISLKRSAAGPGRREGRNE